MNNLESRTFEVILYDESRYYNYFDVLETVQSLDCKYAYILHNNDVYEDDDFTHSVGELKVPHYHLILRFDNRHSIASIQNKLKVPYNSVQIKDNFPKSIEYLTHKNHPNKYQYDWHDIHTNITKIESYFVTVDKLSLELNKVTLLTDFIYTSDKPITISILLDFGISNNCYDVIRRNYILWKDLIKEHNDYLRTQFYKTQELDFSYSSCTDIDFG